ncbi:uncharacterized protein TNCV_1852351 [Trichonephila clavipes]|nr:uncharacterized protein TNCV_1852351 [Trichonephila clavipes]
MGTGFNSKIIKDTIPKQKVSYLTPINFSPTNVAVVTHTMEQAQVVGKECNQTYVQVTYDLAIAKIAYKMQSTSKPQFNNLFIHLGSFHLMMAFFKAIGVFINECGLSHMMIESNITASGSVNGFVEGKHFNRCKRLHPLMALGLKMLHFDPFLNNIEYNFLKEQVIDDLLHYQEVINSHSSMPIELPNNVLSRVLSAYQKFVEETRQDDSPVEINSSSCPTNSIANEVPLHSNTVDETVTNDLHLREEGGQALNVEERNDLMVMLNENKDIFKLGGEPTPFVKHFINTSDHSPVSTAPYRLSPN